MSLARFERGITTEFEDVEAQPRWSSGVRELRVELGALARPIIDRLVFEGKLPETEVDVTAPSPAELLLEDHLEQSRAIADRYAPEWRESTETFIERFIPAQPKERKPGQEKLPFHVLTVIPDPMFLSVSRMLDIEGIKFDRELLRMIEALEDKRWAKLGLPQGPVYQSWVSDPRDDGNGFNRTPVSDVLGRLDPKLFRPGRWSAISLNRIDPSFIKEGNHLHMPGFTAGPSSSPILSDDGGGVWLDRLDVDGAGGDCGVVVEGV